MAAMQPSVVSFLLAEHEVGPQWENCQIVWGKLIHFDTQRRSLGLNRVNQAPLFLH